MKKILTLSLLLLSSCANISENNITNNRIELFAKSLENFNGIEIKQCTFSKPRKFYYLAYINKIAYSLSEETTCVKEYIVSVKTNNSYDYYNIEEHDFVNLNYNLYILMGSDSRLFYIIDQNGIAKDFNTEMQRIFNPK